MRIGLMWFDNDPKSDLATKIGRALDYYQQKYGTSANTVFTNPAHLNPDINIEGVQIRYHRSVLPNHLWIGVGEAVEKGATP